MEKLGTIKEMKCGIKGTIIWASEDGKKVNIEFENGVIMKNRNLSSFLSGGLNPKKPRLEMCKEGDVFISNQGCIFVVKNVFNSMKILIEFQDEYKYQKLVTHNDIKKRSIFNPYNNIVYNIGYLGMERPKKTSDTYIKCYNSWHGMMERCYSEKTKLRQPRYRECTSSVDWLNYSNFKKWFDKNYYEVGKERMCLDKDILVKNNKLYSEDTCIFVPNIINVLFTKTNKFRGKYPIGVYYKKKNKKYIAQCSEIQSNGKKSQTHLGLFNTPEEAFNAYKEYKEKVIKQVADKYKDVIPNKLYEALYKWEVEIND